MHVTSLGAARGDARGGLQLIPFLPWCGMEFHDFDFYFDFKVKNKNQKLRVMTQPLNSTFCLIPQVKLGH